MHRPDNKLVGQLLREEHAHEPSFEPGPEVKRKTFERAAKLARHSNRERLVSATTWDEYRGEPYGCTANRHGLWKGLRPFHEIHLQVKLISSLRLIDAIGHVVKPRAARNLVSSADRTVWVAVATPEITGEDEAKIGGPDETRPKKRQNLGTQGLSDSYSFE
jgi:hypothetical protein